MILIALAAAAAVSASSLGINPTASISLSGAPTPTPASHAFGECHFRVAADGSYLPDPKCTPGAYNPTLTVKVLRDPRFRTDMVRDKATSAAMKSAVYGWYGLKSPPGNVGANQVCEKDHLNDLGAGGADTLDNLWPQCEPGFSRAKPVGQRQFKIKDADAEHRMIAALKAGATDDQLRDEQRRMAADWTQLDAKVKAYVNGAPE